MFDYSNFMFTLPMVEILLWVSPVISMASFSSTKKSSSEASNLIIFLPAFVSTKNLAFECNVIVVLLLGILD